MSTIGKPECYICSDGGCSHNPGGRIYYRVVDIQKDKVVVSKEFPHGTVNFAEYLGLVEAMQYREREQLDLPIYCDSAVALSRVRKKKRRNSYDLSERPELMKEVDEKDRRLHAYNGKVNVQFRDSRAWGEIPADYGNKPGTTNRYPEEAAMEKTKNTKKKKEKEKDSSDNLPKAPEKKEVRLTSNIHNGRMCKEFYGQSYNAMKKIANHNQLMFAMLYSGGCSEEEAYLATFPEAKELYKKIITVHPKIGLPYQEWVVDMEEISRRAKQYAKCLPVKNVCAMLLNNEIEITYKGMDCTKEGLSKVLWHTLYKLDSEVARGKIYASNPLKNIAHEIAVLEGDVEDNNNNLPITVKVVVDSVQQ